MMYNNNYCGGRRAVMPLGCDSLGRSKPGGRGDKLHEIHVYSMLYYNFHSIYFYVRVDYRPAALIDIKPRCAQRDDHAPDKPVSCNLPTFEILFRKTIQHNA